MSKLSYLKENALNAICPYFTMFPLEYPLRHLKKFKSQRARVVDPFCGRGTTLFAARKLGMDAWGVDSSPVAAAIAQAKLATCTKEEVIELATTLLATPPNSIPDSDFFRQLYHENTLQNVCSLREGLLNLEENNASVMLRALALGALHGPLSKSIDAASYFSNQMPRTFASKPDYSVRYWEKRAMTPPQVDVIKVLKRRLDRLMDIEKPITGSPRQVILGDSQCPSIMDSINNDFSVVITSPPYYGMKTYVQDQWLRYWFLGGPAEVDYANGVQLEHSGINTFAESLGRVWGNMGNSTADELRMFIRFGIIPSANVDAKEILAMSLESSGHNWQIVSTRSADTAHKGKRQATQMRSKSNAALEFDFHVLRL